MRTRTWIRRHWRGDLPLAASSWASGTLALFAVSAIIGADRLAVDMLFTHLYLGLIYEVAAHGALTAVLVWWSIGVWRSAARHSRIGQPWGARLAKMAAVPVLLFGAYESAVAGMIAVADGLMYVAGDPYETDNGVRVIADGTELEVYGVITRTVSLDLEKALHDNRRPVVRVRFDSPGGRADAGFEIKRIIEAHGLDTVVEKECSSACVVAFLGGRHRWVARTARMGFHSAYALVGSASAANDRMRQLLAAKGATSSFLDKADAVPSSSIWFPSLDELLAAGVITGIAPDQGTGTKLR